MPTESLSNSPVMFAPPLRLGVIARSLLIELADTSEARGIFNGKLFFVILRFDLSSTADLRYLAFGGLYGLGILRNLLPISVPL